MASKTAFIPGEYWNSEQAASAVARMTATYDSPQFQEVLGLMEAGPEAVLEEARKAATSSAPAEPLKGLARESVGFRRGDPADLPRLTQLIEMADLPPMFIEEFLGGFCVAEHDGEIIGCGGNEIYDDCAVLRSIVVDERARGIGLGGSIAELLIDDAVAAGASDLYLFTADAHAFWLHLGFVDLDFDAWKAAPRACWQYRFLEGHRGLFEVHTMWKRA